jgi:membrane protein implicated in regulation of membrane protease activity
MRLVFTFMLTTAMGFVLAAGLAWLVGLLLPIGRLPVFLVVSVWWIWTGWKYASLRDRHARINRNLDMADAADRRVDAMKAELERADRRGRPLP